MKTIFLSFVILFSINKCQQETLDINYLAQTRGFFLHIEIKGHVLRVTNQRGGETEERELSRKEQDELKDILSRTDFEKIKLTESTKSHYDAAAKANMSLTLNEEHHEFNFDHGNPPKMLDALVNTILTFSENVE